jgi:hypothetical protein
MHPNNQGRSQARAKVSLFGLVLLLSASSAWSEYRVQPIETRSAQIRPGVTLDAGFQYFTDVTLQEADEFDGWTADLDLTIPFMDRFQLRVYLPVYTKGDATLQEDTLWEKKGDSIDIDGWTGVYDFASLTFEHQLMFDDRNRFNLGYYAGVGTSLKPLDTDLTNGDKYNHRGRVAMLGINADGHAWDDKVQLLGNFGFRYYWESDDLNPGGSDTFGAADLKGAMVFQPWGEKLYPVLELTYLGDFGDLNVITLQPELIYPISEKFELRGAVPIGLGGDGNQLGVSAQLGWLF